MSSPRDIPDDSVDYWRRDERTIKLHGPEGFEGMRLAGRLAAETLDMHHAHRRAGRDHRRARQALPRVHPRPQGDPRPARLSRLSRSRSAPRSTTWSATASRATSALQNGDIVNIDVTAILDGWYGDTSRMFFAGEVGVEGAPAVRRHLRGDDARHRGGQAGRARSATSATPSRPMSRAQRFSVVRDFSATASAASSTTRRNILHYGQPGTGPELAARHVLHRRADGECRQPGR